MTQADNDPLAYWPNFETFMAEANLELEGGSDRALVLVFASMADEMLMDLIKRFLVEDANHGILFEGPASALGSFSARIHMAHALGLITAAERTRLVHLQRIRNEMAHRLNRKLSDSDLVERVYQMTGERIPRGGADKTRAAFSLSAFLLLTAISSHSRTLKRLSPWPE